MLKYKDTGIPYTVSDRERKEASDRTRSSISDARRIFRPSGCAAT